jgi:hypothetical protein
MKPSLVNIILFWLAKYLGFYVFMMFKNNNYALLKLNTIKNREDLFYYLWLFLFLPVVSILIFSVPMYFSFKAKSPIYFTLIVGVILVVEYFLYTSLASQSNLMNGIYNGIISILFLTLFFYKYIINVYKQSQGLQG